MITGNTQISLFDNHTGIGPFLTSPTYPGAPTTQTRTLQVSINEKKGTAKVYNAIKGTDLTDKMENTISQVIAEVYSMTVIHP